ncbi:hypothetical protein M9978_13990 [Sphingomonas sp. MG17]|uniref:Uncharacterized protein n=1 Tax=Sphingomonas tagetis TaxID=2949092 RepID=A0A9X2HTB3_9SPHN|nr:hypothetical protein [Sphingomonas tagetis]MCP3731535.1 hypothetical protein [Sphingomonas tagetis]
MSKLLTGALTALIATLAIPAQAQDGRSKQQQPSPASPLAQLAMAGSDQPDVLLDIPNLSVEEITLEVENLQANISLDARLANLLKLTAGAEARVDKVKLSIKGVRAQATLIVRLDNVRAIIERTLQTLDNNPQIIDRLMSTVDNTVGTVGGVAGQAVGTVGGVAMAALGNGQVLDLARAGLTELSRTTNSAGQIVRQVRRQNGQLLEVVTDSANKIISTRQVPATQPAK